MGVNDSPPARFKSLLHWVPAALSVATIAVESTATLSAENTSHWLYPIWVHLFGPISAPAWEEVHHLIRKTGHFVGYGIVSLAFLYGWYQTPPRGERWTLWRHASIWAVACTLLIAVADEFHQSFLPSRTSSPIDVGIDLCGAVTAQLLALAIALIFARRA